MAVFTGVNVGGSSPEELTDAVIGLNRTLEFQMANLDSDNVREIGGWRVGPTQLTSKDLDVGLSTDDSQEENIRFWAGSVTAGDAPFRVYDSGRFVATGADLTGRINMTDGAITWGPVNAPLYEEVGGIKPPLDADNTSDALPASLGINFTQIGLDYIYTGKLSANQINAGTLNANYINGGTLTGISIDVSTDVTVGNNIYIGSTTDTAKKQIWLSGQNVISGEGGKMTISSDWLVLEGTVIEFDSANISGINVTAKFG